MTVISASDRSNVSALKKRERGYYRLLSPIFLLIPVLSVAQEPCTGSIKIELTNIRSVEGSIVLGIYKTPDEWPYYPSYNFIVSKDSMLNNRVVYTIDSIPCGRYSILVLDDENVDQKMEYSGLGFPREGWGFSNNPGFLRLKEPTFEECLFEVNNSITGTGIKMNYISGSNKSKE